MVNDTPGLIRFGRFQLDVQGRELQREGVSLDVQPRTLALLVHLALHPDRVVTKAELAEAVWGGPDTSDEMIARAVMKARQALGDDARSPTYILTESGQGYRFRMGEKAQPHAAPPAATITETPDAAAWYVLPFVNRSEDPALNWATTGLQRLLCHVMERSSPGAAVTAEPPGGVLGSDTGMPSGRVMRALAVRPAARWVACEIDRTPAGYRLDLAWAGPGEPLAAFNLTHSELPALVLAAAEQLLPALPWQRELARRHPQAWAQLHEAIAHLHRRSREEAQRELARCFERLPGHPRLMLQHAELLITLQAYPIAGNIALQAQELLDAQGESARDAQLLVRVVLAAVATRTGDLVLAQQRLDMCRQFIEQHPAVAGDHGSAAKLWSGLAYLQREGGNFAAAEAAFEQAARAALRAGVVELEIEMRSSMAYVMSINGQPHRAEELLRSLAARASELGLHEMAGRCLSTLGNSMHNHGRHQRSVRWAERGLALLLPATNKNFLLDGRTVCFEGLVSQGRLADAEVTLRWRMDSTVGDVLNDVGLQAHLAWLRWRQGRMAEAEACYRQVLAEPRMAAWQKWANFLRSELATLLALQGRCEEGRASLAALPEVTLPMVVGRAQAALAMAEGRRQQARELLAALAPQATLGHNDAYRIVLDLAWLCLEDGDALQAEELLDRAIAMEVETPELQWLELSLQDHVQPVAAEAWQTLRARSPSLIRACPALGTPDDVQARRQGSAAPLPNLLTVLAW